MCKFRRKKLKTPLQVLVEGFFEVRSGYNYRVYQSLSKFIYSNICIEYQYIKIV